jgi:general secretion pathway protein B
LGGSLPELRLDLHVYTANPAERYAFINMHKVREGETTVEGVQVKEITRDGVVLDYRGTEFLLGRQ